jgi:hypothetical protein
MKRLLYFLILVVISGPSCLKDPDPPNEEIRSFVILYNFLSESYSLSWEVDEGEVLEEHMYGTIVSGSVLLFEDTKDVPFVVKNRLTQEELASFEYELTGDKFYIILVYGSGDDPQILFKELDTEPPPTGFTKHWFFHAAQAIDSLDVYMGGAALENKVVSGLAYGERTDNFLVSEFDAIAMVAVTLHDSLYREENELIYKEKNDQVQTEKIYLNVLAPSSALPHSDLEIWLYEHPSYEF